MINRSVLKWPINAIYLIVGALTMIVGGYLLTVPNIDIQVIGILFIGLGIASISWAEFKR